MTAASTSLKTGNVVPLVTANQEARVDSRVIAAELGNVHIEMLYLIEQYQNDFEEFGVVRFQTQKPPKGSKGGRPERFALLNEDQCYLLLTYARNTPEARRLKVALVKSFAHFRDGRAIEADYLPFYRALHDEVKTLAERAHEAGSSAPERVFHINVNNLVNRALGLDSGQRGRLSAAQRLAVTGAQAVALEALRQAMDDGADHHEAHQRAKQAVERYADGAGLLLAAKGAS